jgi:hypothetical protein
MQDTTVRWRDRTRLSSLELREIIGDPNRYVSDVIAALIAGIPVGTLRRWRHEGRGPRYVKCGASRNAGVRYRVAWLLEYMDPRIVETNDTRPPEAA